MHINKNVDQLEPTPIREYSSKYKKIPGLLNFTIGEPDFTTPQFILDAMKKAMDEGQTHYAPTAGIPELREAIASHYKRRQGLDLNKDQIIVTVGAAEALGVSAISLLKSGDEALVPSPFYPVYRSNITIPGAKMVNVDTSSTQFKLTPDALESALQEHPKIRVIFLNYPNNPTGATYTEEEVKALAEVIRQHEVMVISDEVYAELTFTGDHYSLFHEIPEQMILVSGASKSFAMTGFRLGFMYVPERYYDDFFDLHQVLVSSVATPIQYGAVTAYNDGDDAIDQMKDEYDRRRHLLIDALSDIGLDAGSPAGAFYAFPSIPEQYDGDDKKFCDDLASQAKVGVLPGSIFGPGGEGHFRLSYAANIDDLTEGFNRMKQFVENL